MIISIVVTIIISLVAVLIHYESLLRLTSLMKHVSVRPRFRMIFVVVGVLLAHVAEVWLFALGYYYLVKRGDSGELLGNFTGAWLDCTYYSFSTYTSLGFGDIIPDGPLRFLTGMEALTGLVLIAWTASFLFFEMQRFWSNREIP